MWNSTINKPRLYTALGAGLMLISMILKPFWFSTHDDLGYGGEIWMVSIWAIALIITYPSVAILAAFISALFNIPQLIMPFWNNPRVGTSRLFVFTFSAVAFVILPLLVLYIQIDDTSKFIYREGYILYQTAYILSAIGFRMKRKLLLEENDLSKPDLVGVLQRMA
jgi:hypothetical protein